MVVSDHTCRVVAYHIVSSDAHCILVNLLIVFVFVMSLYYYYYMSKMNKTPMSLYTSNTSVRDETKYDMLRLKRKCVDKFIPSMR